MGDLPIESEGEVSRGHSTWVTSLELKQGGLTNKEGLNHRVKAENCKLVNEE